MQIRSDDLNTFFFFLGRRPSRISSCRPRLCSEGCERTRHESGKQRATSDTRFLKIYSDCFFFKFDMTAWAKRGTKEAVGIITDYTNNE